MSSTGQSGQNNELVQKLTQIVLDNLNNEQFGVSVLAELAGMNRSHLHRKIKLLTKKSLSQFIREIRLIEALKLLTEESVTVSEVAYRVGFNNPSYFNSCFHDHYGFPPGEAKHVNVESTLRYRKSEESPGKHRPSFAKKYVFIAIFFFLIFVSMAAVFFLKKDKQLIEEKSIAVLPFKNLSEERGNEYFVDGLVEDLLSRISVIEELKVISSTSSEMYRQRGAKSIPEIASELGVSYILDGSVQRYGDKARIMVKLIDAINDDNIWAENYDRDIVDVFKTQSEIAMRITSELNAILTSEQKTYIQENKTKNVKAFELYQMGRFHINKRTGDGFTTGIEYFEKAIDEDPSYGLAYAGLAETYHLMGAHGWMDRQEGRDKAEELALKALELDGNLAEAYAVLGTIYDYVDWDWENAEKAFKRALEINPNYSTAHQYYSEHLRITGRHEEARMHIDKAIELNPLSFIIRFVRGYQMYYNSGLFQEALAEIQKCNELQENHRLINNLEFRTYWQLGEEEKSYEALRKILIRRAIYDLEIADNIYKDSGLQSAIEWKLKIDEANDESNPQDIAETYGMIGADEKAMEWLEKALLLNKLHVRISYSIHYKNLHNNPRFLALLEKQGLTPQSYSE